MQTCTHAHMDTRACTHAHAHVHMHTHRAHKHKHAHTHTHAVHALLNLCDLIYNIMQYNGEGPFFWYNYEFL
jgi:hypothetical protein